MKGLKENVLIGKLLPAGTGLRGPLKSPETLAREAEEAFMASQEELDGEFDDTLLLDENNEILEQAD